MEYLDRIFKLKERNTTLWREVLGGVTTFMALSYIIFVQPAMLTKAGTSANPFPPGGILVATCVGSAIACLFMAFLANYPIALAPAMGHNVFFTFIVCGEMGYSWQAGLAAVFIGGCLFAVLSFFGFRARIMELIPDSLKRAIAGGIGLLLTLIGLEYAGIVIDAPAVLVRFGDIHNPYTLLAIGGLIVTFGLMALEVRGAILIGIITTAVAGLIPSILGFELLNYSEVSSYGKLFDQSTVFKLSFSGLFETAQEWSISSLFAHKGPLTVILTFLFLDVFDTVGTLVGVSERAGLMENGELPGARWALFSDSAGTVTGAVMGTSTITSYVESAAGVQAGARTGLANVATAICFLGAILLYPFLGIVSSEVGSGLYPVIAPALVAVGTMMLTSIRDLEWDDYTELIPAFLTLVIMAFTVSITEGIAMGFIAYSILKCVTGRAGDVHWGFHVVSMMLLLRYILLA